MTDDTNTEPSTPGTIDDVKAKIEAATGTPAFHLDRGINQADRPLNMAILCLEWISFEDGSTFAENDGGYTVIETNIKNCHRAMIEHGDMVFAGAIYTFKLVPVQGHDNTLTIHATNRPITYHVLLEALLEEVATQPTAEENTPPAATEEVPATTETVTA